MTRFLVFGILYLAAAALGQWPTLAPGLTATLWIPSGLTLGVLLTADIGDRWKYVSVAFVTDAAAEYFIYAYGPGASVVVALGNTLEAVAACYLILRFCGTPYRFDNVRDILALPALSAIPCTMISASFGTAALATSGVQDLVAAWVLWWIGDAIGVIIVAPVVITLRSVSYGKLLRSQPALVWVEKAALAGGLFVSCHLFFTDAFPFSFVISPFLVWAALRFGMRGAAFSMLVVAGMTFSYVTSGFEPFNHRAVTPYERTVIVQAFLGIVAISTLLLAAITEQRDRALQRLKFAEGQLRDTVRIRTRALEASEELRELALDGAQAAEWHWDVKKNQFEASPRYRNLTGCGDQPLSLGEWLALVHADDRPRLRKRIEQMLSTPGDDIWSEEFRILHPDRGLVWLGGKGRLMRDVHGTAFSIAGISIDVTARRNVEYQLRLQEHSHSKLARLGALGELSAGIAHEITQPLMAAGTYGRLVEEALSQDNADRSLARKAAQKATRQIERASEVVRRLRDLVKLGRIEVTPMPFGALIDNAIELLRPELERAEISIVRSASVDATVVEIVALQIAQVIVNVLRNAVEAMQEAGQRAGSINVDVAPAEGGMVEISFRDTGPGFRVEQIGIPLHHFITTKSEGLGIGLSLCASIVSAHGGSLWIGANNPGGVVHFTLRRSKGAS